MSTLHPALPLEALWIGEMQACEVNGERILLARLEQGVVACRDRCPHQGYPLSRGSLDGSVLRCALHLWEFDLASGRGVNPASACLQQLPVEVRDGQILVGLEKAENVA